MKYCVWKSGEWCMGYDLQHYIEEHGTPDIEFDLPFHLPFPVEQAFIESLIPGITRHL